MQDYTNMLREVVKNGGGLVTPFVLMSRLATVQPESEAKGNAEMLGESSLLGKSAMRDYAKILDNGYAVDSVLQNFAKLGGNARLERCKLIDMADVRGDAYLIDSVIGGSTIVTGKTRVLRSTIVGNVRILDNAVLRGVHVAPNMTVVIEESAYLDFPKELTLQCGTRLSEGRWTRPPLVVNTPVFTMCEDVDDKVKVGCLSYSIAFWKEQGRKALLRYGLKEDIYEEMYSALLELEAFKRRNPSPKGKQK